MGERGIRTPYFHRRNLLIQLHEARYLDPLLKRLLNNILAPHHLAIGFCWDREPILGFLSLYFLFLRQTLLYSLFSAAAVNFPLISTSHVGCGMRLLLESLAAFRPGAVKTQKNNCVRSPAILF